MDENNHDVNVSCSFSLEKHFNDSIPHCPSTQDKLGVCWEATSAGTWAFQNCPDLDIFDVTGQAKKFCTGNGTWFIHPEFKEEWADYSRCLRHSKDSYIVYVYFGGYAVSAICLTISLIVFYLLKQLQCDRITLHKNLFLCYLFNAISWIVYYAFLILDMEPSPMCRVFHFLATYFSAASYFWMFSEGIYLAMLLQFTFSRGKFIPYICFLCGWGIPLILTIIYVIVRYKVENPKNCWREESNLINITIVPALLALMANFIIILFILRVLIRKLRAPSSREERQTSKTAKAVFILVPLLGLYNILFLVHPGTSMWGTIHDYANSLLTSTQGALISFLLCFVNSEVLSACQRRVQQRSLRSRNSVFSITHHRRDTCTSDLIPFNSNVSPNHAPTNPDIRKSIELRSVRRTSRRRSSRSSST